MFGKLCEEALLQLLDFLSVRVRLRKKSETRKWQRRRGGGEKEVVVQQRKLFKSFLYTNRALFTKGKHIFNAIVQFCLILGKIVYYAFLPLSNYNLP